MEDKTMSKNVKDALLNLITLSTTKTDSEGNIRATDREKKHFESYSESVVASTPPLSPFSQINRDENIDAHPECNIQSVMHTHSAPEKLLASQLHIMDLLVTKVIIVASPTCQWSQSALLSE